MRFCGLCCAGPVYAAGPAIGAVRVLSGGWSRREGGLVRAAGGAASFFRGGWPGGAGLAHTHVMTVWSMLEECAGQLDEPFRRSEMIGWFRRHHPDVNEATLGAHIQAATENAANRARNNRVCQLNGVTCFSVVTYVPRSGGRRR